MQRPRIAATPHCNRVYAVYVSGMTQTEATAIRVSKGTRDALKEMFPNASADEAVSMLLTSFQSRRSGRRAVTTAQRVIAVLGTTESDGVERLSGAVAAAAGKAARGVRS